MIRLILGGIGSGKSLCAVAEIAAMPPEVAVYTNFPLTTLKHHRLRTDEIVTRPKDEKGRPLRPAPNLGFWSQELLKNERISIYLDEVHNILDARNAMTNWNKAITKWITQVRKVLGENEENNLTLISQRANAVDVFGRDLAGEVVMCEKVLICPTCKAKCRDAKVMEKHFLATGHKGVLTATRWRGRKKEKELARIIIIKNYFRGRFCIDKYRAFLNGQTKPDMRSTIEGNDILQFYESYALVDFGQEVYL